MVRSNLGAWSLSCRIFKQFVDSGASIKSDIHLGMSPDFLKKRNALWAALRQLEPTDPDTQALLLELEALIGWSRERIFAGLGWILEDTKK
jgi:hypothetical protein